MTACDYVPFKLLALCLGLVLRWLRSSSCLKFEMIGDIPVRLLVVLTIWCVPAMVEPLLAMDEAGGPAVFLDSSEWLLLR